jgi:death-on-curing protein
MTPEFLTAEDVIELHARLITSYGGTLGVRDRALLEASVDEPRSRFGARLVHSSLFDMAGALLLHLARDEPFVDGNRRTALFAALVFLDLNGVTLRPSPALVELAVQAGAGKSSRARIADELRLLEAV